MNGGGNAGNFGWWSASNIRIRPSKRRSSMMLLMTVNNLFTMRSVRLYSGWHKTCDGNTKSNIARSCNCWYIAKIRAAQILYYNSSQSFSSTQYSPSSHSISPLAAFPSSFSTSFFLAPTLVFDLFSFFVFSETSSTLHKRYLPVMFARDPSMYACITVHEAYWRGGGSCDRCYTDRAEL